MVRRSLFASPSKPAFWSTYTASQTSLSSSAIRFSLAAIAASCPHHCRMTAAQRDAIYGNSSNAPKQTSNVSQAQAEAKQKVLEREKVHQDAVNSDTVAIDFSHPSVPTPGSAAQATAVLSQRDEMSPTASAESIASNVPGASKTVDAEQPRTAVKTDPMAPYNFDGYQGHLYRVFEGTVLEGVVTNHIDGGLAGPILIMLRTDYSKSRAAS